MLTITSSFDLLQSIVNGPKLSPRIQLAREVKGLRVLRRSAELKAAQMLRDNNYRRNRTICALMEEADDIQRTLNEVRDSNFCGLSRRVKG